MMINEIEAPALTLSCPATCVHGYPAARERSPYAGLVDRSGHVMPEFESFVTVDDDAHADSYGTRVCDVAVTSTSTERN